MRATRWYGVVKGGMLELDNREMLLQWLKTIKDGTRVEIVIDKEGKDPTTQQWGYLYGAVYAPFAEHFGWTPDEVDDYMKREFQSKHLIHLPKGLTLSKASFNRDWLSKYIDFCRKLAAEQGVCTQEPSTVWE